MDFQQIRDFVNPAVAQATGMQEVENLSMPVPVAYVPVQLVIDGALSLTSENPVQNKVIAVAIQNLDGRITAVEGQFSEGVTEAVNNWLAAHPEATTTVQDGAITYAKLDANLKGEVDQISDLKSAFNETIVQNANLLDTTKNIPDSYIKNTNGQLTPYTGWQASDYIRIKPNTDYYFIIWNQQFWNTPNSVYYAFYDVNKTFTHGGITSNTAGKLISSSSNSFYVRVSAQNASMTTSLPMFGTVSALGELLNDTDKTKYIPYGNTLAGDTLKQELTSEIQRIEGELLDVAIVLPANVCIAVGRQITFYKPNFLRCKNPDDYVAYWYTNTASTSFDENLRLQPTTAGTYTAILFILNRYNRQTIAQKTISITVVPDTARTGKTVLFIGDSLTAAGFYPYEIQHHLSADGVTSIGTLSTTAYLDSDPAVTARVTVNHEGRGGWSAQDYITKESKSGVTNAFWNPSVNAFDFSFYMTQTGFTRPDIVFVNLGTNGTSDPTAEIAAINTIIASIKEYDATMKIVVSAIACGNATQNQYIDIYLTQIRELQLQAFDGAISNVYIAPIYLNINRLVDWKTEDVAESERNPKIVTRQIDSVHPSKYGYFKFADVYWSVIQYIMGL